MDVWSRIYGLNRPREGDFGKNWWVNMVFVAKGGAVGSVEGMRLLEGDRKEKARIWVQRTKGELHKRWRWEYKIVS